ncbi:MAG: response regulator [Chloroflexi bacterium]|nr:response regulator [Chloroflexota bacterium]
MRLEYKNVFVIEDDAENLAVIFTILRREGANVHFDRWGMETLDRIKQHGSIDIILCDLMLLGEASGYDVLKLVRADTDVKDVPVVAVTASDPDVEMEKVREAGFNGFISKPLNRRAFGGQIVAILKGAEVWNEDVTD